MTAYAALCCLVYVYANLWIGWLVVIATAIWMGMAIVHATQTGNRFSMGFSAIGCVWLLTCLGFSIQTPLSIEGNHIRPVVYRIVNFGRGIPVHERGGPVTTYAQYHDLYTSGAMAHQSAGIVVPSWNNAIRLACCLTALFSGVLGGTCCHIFGKENKAINSRSRAERPIEE